MKELFTEKDKVLQRLILIYVYFINIYYVYRYIFKYNSENTSPTYTNTPVTIQNFKYYVAATLFVLTFLLLIKSETKIRIGSFEIIVCFIALALLIKSVIVSNYVLFIKIYSFFAMAYFVTYVERIGDFINKFLNSNRIILLYHIVYSLIQIFLYIFYRRLPALAYPNGYVRFGGGWDDPNSFGIYLCIPIVYLFCTLVENKKDWEKIILLILCLGLEFLTLSITAYVGVAVCLLLITVRYRTKIKSKSLLFPIVCGTTLIVANFSSLCQIAKWKSASIKLHMAMLLPHLGKEGSRAALFWIGSKKYEHSENFYNMILQNMGVPYWIAMIGITVYGIYIAYVVYKRSGKKIVSFVGMTFLTAYSVAQLGIPFHICVPVNYIYWLIFFIIFNVYRKYKAEEKNESNVCYR